MTQSRGKNDGVIQIRQINLIYYTKVYAYPLFSYRVFSTVQGITNKNGVPRLNKHKQKILYLAKKQRGRMRVLEKMSRIGT